MLTALLLIAAALPTQATKDEPTVVGVWVLRSVTLDGKPFKDVPNVLNQWGGVEAGMN